MSDLGFWQDPAMVLVLILVVVVLLYLARKQAHQVIKSGSRVMSNAFRMAARSVLLAESKLRQRNKEVLLAEGLLEVERELERILQ